MKRLIFPFALFLTLVLSVIVLLPLEDSVLVISVAAFFTSLAGLAWWVFWGDQRPLAAVQGAPVDDDHGYLSDDFDAFERAFWAHVAEHETTSDLD
jgi:hypothetical protein